jgi:hypothetical protein
MVSHLEGMHCALVAGLSLRLSAGLLVSCVFTGAGVALQTEFERFRTPEQCDTLFSSILIILC